MEEEEKKSLKELKAYLEEELKDCLKLKKSNDLTKEGEGMLATLLSIYQYMDWKIPNEEM